MEFYSLNVRITYIVEESMLLERVGTRVCGLKCSSNNARTRSRGFFDINPCFRGAALGQDD